MLARYWAFTRFWTSSRWWTFTRCWMFIWTGIFLEAISLPSRSYFIIIIIIIIWFYSFNVFEMFVPVLYKDNFSLSCHYHIILFASLWLGYRATFTNHFLWEHTFIASNLWIMCSSSVLAKLLSYPIHLISPRLQGTAVEGIAKLLTVKNAVYLDGPGPNHLLIA